MDTETKAPAVKSGLKTKEVFVLDSDYFKIGDIYLLRISPEFQGEIHRIYTGVINDSAALPTRTYAVCSDVCDTAVDFIFKRADEDDLCYIQIHAEDIENGLIEVTRKLCNEALNLDKEYNRYEG